MEKKIKVIKNIPCVKNLISEIQFLEYYLLDSPWKYTGDGKAIKPTFKAIKTNLNGVLKLLLDVKK